MQDADEPFGGKPPGESPDPPPEIPGHALLRCFARGAYGEVWLARTELGAFRAVKVVRRASFKDSKPYDREFAGLQRYEPISREHEGLVDVLQVGCNESAGFFHYVMELADAAQPPEEDGRLKMEDGGREQLVSRHPQSSILDPRSYSPLTLAHAIKTRGKLPVSEVVEIGLKLARALEFLHSRRLVHRDIKPSNIIFVGGQPKLADVGLVGELDSPQSFVGTEGYIPPEGPGTAQADIFSLGKVLYEAATGKDRSEFPDLPTRLGEDENDRALAELNEVLLKACETNSRSRYRTAAAMAADLERLKAGQSLRARRVRMDRLRRVALVLVSAVGLLMFIIALARIIEHERLEPRLLFSEEFDGQNLDNNRWVESHRDSTTGEGRTVIQVGQTGGDLLLKAEAQQSDGNSVGAQVWVDSTADLRQFAPCRVEIQMRGVGRSGLCAIGLVRQDYSGGEHDRSRLAVQPFAEFDAYGAHYAHDDHHWNSRTIWIDLLRDREAAVIYPNSNQPDEFDVIDLSAVESWKLRFFVQTVSVRFRDSGLAELRIGQVRIWSLPKPPRIVGKVRETVSGWPVADASVTAESRQVSTNTSRTGAFILDSAYDGSLRVRKTDYDFMTDDNPGVATNRGLLQLQVRKTRLRLGDVVEVVTNFPFHCTSIGFWRGTLFAVTEPIPEDFRLTPVCATSLQHAGVPTEVQLPYKIVSFANCDERMIGLSFHPGRIHDLIAEPIRPLLDLKRPGKESPISWVYGSVYDGRHLWFIENEPTAKQYGLHRLDIKTMTMQGFLESNDNRMCGLAWDGKYIWICNESGSVYRIDPEVALRFASVEKGITSGRFNGNYSRIAYGDGFLWGLEANERRICKIKLTD